MRPLISTTRQIAVLSGIALALTFCLAGAEVNPSTAKDSIVGTVLAPTGEPLEGATVIVSNINTGDAIDTATDEHGNYRLTNLAKGTYEISVVYEGYDPYSSSEIKIDGETAVRHDVRMVELPQQAPDK